MREDIKHLPKPIRKLAQKREKENPLEGAPFGFTWLLSKENYGFWDSIYSGNYKPFYKMYPKKSKKKQSIEDLTKQADWKYSFGYTKFEDPKKKFVATDYRLGTNVLTELQLKYNDALPIIYAPTLRKVIKKAIKASKK